MIFLRVNQKCTKIYVYVREKAFECIKTSEAWVGGGYSAAGGKSIHKSSSFLQIFRYCRAPRRFPQILLL